VLASGSVDRTIRLWNPNTGTLLKTLPHAAETVTHLRFDLDHQLSQITVDGSVQAINLNPSELHQRGCDRLTDYLNYQRQTAAAGRSICR
jgi:WD40 repeat protein